MTCCSPIGTSARTEEQVQYHPLLAMDPSILLTYNHSVTGVSAIVCAPTALESTSLVLTTGLDTFLTHVAPSKKFDSLSADFNKPVLLASLVAMIVGTLVARWRWQAASLSAAWE